MWEHKPGPAEILSKEEHEDNTLERIVLELNGVEPVPALLLIPRKRQTPARCCSCTRSPAFLRFRASPDRFRLSGPWATI